MAVGLQQAGVPSRGRRGGGVSWSCCAVQVGLGTVDTEMEFKAGCVWAEKGVLGREVMGEKAAA